METLSILSVAIALPEWPTTRLDSVSQLVSNIRRVVGALLRVSSSQ